MSIDKLPLSLRRRLAAARLSALCLSGGGIRSATFCLGVLQALAKHGLLNQMDYLSTVSGGGYIGSWFSSWIHRHKDGAAGVIRELRESTEGQRKKEIEHLRTFSNYLAPNASVLSADTWTLIKTYLRNLLINWLVLIPLLTAIICLPKLVLSLVSMSAASPSALMGNMTIAIAALLIAIGLRYIITRRPDTKCVPPNLNNQSQFLGWCFFPLVAGVMALTVAWAMWSTKLLEYLDQRGWELATTALVGGAVIHIVALALACVGSERGLIRLGKFKWGVHHISFKVSDLIVATASGLVAGGFAALMLRFVFPQPSEYPPLYAAFAPSMFMLVLPIVGTLVVALSSRRTSDEDREWWAKAGGWFLIFIVMWAALAPLVLFAHEIVNAGHQLLGKSLAALGGLGGLIAIASGFSTKTGGLGAAADSPSRHRKLFFVLANGGAIVFLLCLVVGLSLFADWLQSFVKAGLVGAGFEDKVGTDSAAVWMVFAALIGSSVLVDWLTNLNSLSLHGIYRLRLMRAYLGAAKLHRDPVSFTGFDETDNLEMRQLWPNPRPNGEPARMDRPFHIVNTAMNLVTNDNLAWQQRKAASFTISPLHCGSAMSGVGFRYSKEYGGGDKPISLATAMTISGAAVSPKMGYHSSPVVAFLLTFFNVRLGCWLGNPSRAGEATYRHAAPQLMLPQLVAEAFGLSGASKPYLYLSDGGHFDNLGLYEMVRRHCRHIVVIDAGADESASFFDLGSAVHKIRVDHGIEIRMIDKMFIRPRSKDKSQPQPGAYCALGQIEYGEGLPPGRLLYIKPCIYEGEPLDVASRAHLCPEFPHESTADQFFSESQFESYRALGQFIIDAIRREPTWQSSLLDDFMDQARGHIWRQSSPNSEMPALKVETAHLFGDRQSGFRVNIIGQGFSPLSRVVCDCQIVDHRVDGPRRIAATLPFIPPAINKVELRIVNPNYDVAVHTLSIPTHVIRPGHAQPRGQPRR